MEEKSGAEIVLAWRETWFAPRRRASERADCTGDTQSEGQHRQLSLWAFSGSLSTEAPPCVGHRASYLTRVVWPPYPDHHCLESWC